MFGSISWYKLEIEGVKFVDKNLNTLEIGSQIIEGLTPWWSVIKYLSEKFLSRIESQINTIKIMVERLESAWVQDRYEYIIMPGSDDVFQREHDIIAKKAWLKDYSQNPYTVIENSVIAIFENFSINDLNIDIYSKELENVKEEIKKWNIENYTYDKWEEWEEVIVKYHM